MKLAGSFALARVEVACTKVLSYIPNPNSKNITTVLQNGQDKVKSGIPAPDNR